MVRMKKNEFRALVKECVRECLREIMQEQINPLSFPIREAAQSPIPGLGVAGVGLINPMDDHQMRLRQEIMNQRGMMQSQLQRQALQNSINPMQQPLGALPELAGLPSGNDDPRKTAQRYAMTDGGYTNPSDRLKQIDPYAQQRYNPQLDVPRSGAPTPSSVRAPRFDPSLDTTPNGEIRAPDPNVLCGIFEDTMRTTFIDQAQGEQQGPIVDRYAARVANSNPDELFPGSQNWASLAFNR
jgi:hypothetical protein